MFRPMRRFKQQIADSECSEEDNKIYFHGAKEGHKIDAIRNYDKASFCVYDSGYRKEGE